MKEIQGASPSENKSWYGNRDKASGFLSLFYNNPSFIFTMYNPFILCYPERVVAVVHHFTRSELMKKLSIVLLLCALFVLPAVSAFSYRYGSYRDYDYSRYAGPNVALIIVTLGVIALAVLANIFFFIKTGDEKETWKGRLKLVNKLTWGFLVALILVTSVGRMPVLEIEMRGDISILYLIVTILMGLYAIYSIVAHYLFLTTKEDRGCTFVELLDFKAFVIPTILQVLYYATVFVSFILGLSMIFDEKEAGLVVIIAGPIVYRIFTELALVLFKIEKNTRK